ncbi:hypothetical protein BDA99DRAFT_493394 [Phascolomyces articulosus]|uniref:Uncharacterized protein n=1 Tax=Phascolomyces articulosus TaxID=60185 RepID=A0AAD5L0N7_9FUNG|nr:hypothetical protein BDA99DRAFT_493394 [Phascolomyces articulosus]
MTLKEDNYFIKKVAVITGGSRGIGRAVAEALVARGSKVVIGDVLDGAGQETVNELNAKANDGEKNAIYVHTDVTVYKDVITLFKSAESEFGGVDIAFLNAGVINKPDFMFTPLEDEADDFLPDINFTGVVKCTRVAALAMARRGGGVITITASCAGFGGPFALSVYNASKHAMIGWTRSLGMLKDICNVRVNAVCPHWVETDMRHKITGYQVDPYGPFVQESPTVKIDTVVKAVLTLMEDPNRNSETLMALPPDVIRAQPPIPAFPEQSNPAYDKRAVQYEKDALEYYKSLLDPALKRYEQL